ncbi:MAG: TonB-dependent receptor [Gemmatimonadota bacterium]
MTQPKSSHPSRQPVTRWLLAGLAVLGLAATPPAAAQQGGTGTIRGKVTRSDDHSPITVQVSVAGTGLAASTGTDGRYVIYRVPAGPQTLVFRWPGYRPAEFKVTVVAGETVTADAALEPVPVALGELVVEAASRTPERVVEAPAAVTVIDPYVTATTSITGQPPLALQAVPGVDLVQNGMNDFNLNARGLNSSLNRRVLVLQDGRDLAMAFLGAQEWNAMAAPLEDMTRMEMVRGPGSALFGANAFNGVLNIVTPKARDIVGTKLTMGGGELSTFRADLRHARVFGQGRFGFKANVGYNTSDTWTRSRTSFDGRDIVREYAVATDSVPRGFGSNLSTELVPLKGQSKDATTGAAIGDPDALQNVYGSARFDYYTAGGAVGTIEGGYADVRNETAVTGIGRVQVLHTVRPWLRASWDAEHFSLMAYYNGRETKDDQRALSTGAGLRETAAIYHVEGQYNRQFAGDRARVVLGASYRNYNLNTEGTLMRPQNDDRSDNYGAAFGQFEWKFGPKFKAVAAARYDDGNLIKGQFSPKAALVFTPSPNHAFRATYNRAFQTPNYSEFFLQVNIPGDKLVPFATVEAGLEQLFNTVRTLPGAPPLPSSLPWNFSATTRAYALGNQNLDVEKVNGYEVGYKGTFGRKLSVSVDLWLNSVKDFVTDLLPGGANPTYQPFLLTAGDINVPANLAAIEQYVNAAPLPAASKAQLLASVAQLRGGYTAISAFACTTPGQGGCRGPLVATLEDGSKALVVSYGQAGRVKQRGIEVGVGYNITSEFRADLGYAFFDSEYFNSTLEGVQQGDLVQPNTPKHKGSAGLSYVGQRLDFSAQVLLQDGFQWAAGVYAGWVPSSQIVNANLGFKINNNLRVFANAMNLFDQQRYSLFAGSVNGRRILGGVTTTF